MAGEGSIQAMIVSLRNNKRLLRKRNPFQRLHGFEKLRKDYIKYSQGKVLSKPLSDQELQEIRKKIKQENRKDFLKLSILGTLLLVLTLVVGISLYNQFLHEQQEIERKKLQTKTEQYLFYINDGDAWLKKQHWNNAIFQYLLAKNIFPNEYSVNYRLALAYGNKCKFEGSGCREGSELLTKLERQFPKKKELQTLSELFISKAPYPF